jgi:hypothetical protein
MTHRMGTFVSLSVGGFLGVVASFIPMIFGPLVFPLAVSSPTPGEDIVGVAIPAFFLVFGAIGFFTTRRLIARFIDHGTDTNFTIFRNPVFSSIPHRRSRLKAPMKSVEILKKELAEAEAQEVEAFKEFRRDSNPGAEKEWLNVMENSQRLAEELSRRKRLGNTKVN